MTATLFGIQGGIGSGKSFLANKLEIVSSRRGTHRLVVIDTDKLAREVIYTSEHRPAIARIFSSQALENPGYNMRFISEQFFADEKVRDKMESTFGGQIRNALEHSIRKVSKEADGILIESALTTFNGLDFRSIIVATCPLDVRIERVKRRDGFSEAKIRRVVQTQPNEVRYLIDRRAFAFDTDDTDSTFPQYLMRIEALFARITATIR